MQSYREKCCQWSNLRILKFNQLAGRAPTRPGRSEIKTLNEYTRPHTSHLTSHTLHLTHHITSLTLHLTPYTLHLTSYISHLTPHISPLTLGIEHQDIELDAVFTSIYRSLRLSRFKGLWQLVTLAFLNNSDAFITKGGGKRG